jgi:hypothetical protein
MDAMHRGDARDALTRTTLRLGDGAPASSLAHVVRALQRVPGVLTVEAVASNTEARVAHDGGVPLASLVAAIGSVGVLATVGSDVASRVLPARTATPSNTSNRHLPNAAVVAILTVVLIETVFPVNSEKRWIFIMSLVLLWSIGLVARLAVTRRHD